LLAQLAPPSMPVVLAIEAEEGWLLVEDVGATLVGELPADQRGDALAAGAQAISELQRSVAGDLDAFAAAGCPRRSLADMPGQLGAVLGPDGVAIADPQISTERRERAVELTRSAVERVTGLGFPTSVVHGDFHPGNAFLVGERIVIIDWSDAAIGNPLVDLVTWLSWSRDEPDQQGVATDAWIDSWAGSTDPVAVREAIGDILRVGAAYQVISYDAILRGLEPATRYTLADGAAEYFNRLEALIRPS
jgi:Phosphotransferase enzyme family